MEQKNRRLGITDIYAVEEIGVKLEFLGSLARAAIETLNSLDDTPDQKYEIKYRPKMNSMHLMWLLEEQIETLASIAYDLFEKSKTLTEYKQEEKNEETKTA